MSALEQVDVLPVRRSSLRAVETTQPTRALPRGFFPVMIIAILAIGMVGQLMLQTKIQEQAFQLGDLQAQATELGAQQAILEVALEKQSSPEQLARSAAALGMVANPYSTFLTLPSGEISGLKKPVRGDELPIISTPTQPDPGSDWLPSTGGGVQA